MAWRRATDRLSLDVALASAISSSSHGRNFVKSRRGWSPRCRPRRWRSDTSSGRHPVTAMGRGGKPRRASGWRGCRMIPSRAKCWCTRRGTRPFGEIPVIMQPLIDSGRATASDYNQYAWTALLTQPVCRAGRGSRAHGLRRDAGPQLRHQSHAGLCVCRDRQAARSARPAAQGHGAGGHRQA